MAYAFTATSPYNHSADPASTDRPRSKSTFLLARGAIVVVSALLLLLLPRPLLFNQQELFFDPSLLLDRLVFVLATVWVS